MAELDLKLAEWALGVAKKSGATAAEVLLVSGESLSAGVRLGEVEKLKSSRERRLGLRVFSGQSSATSSTAEIEQAVGFETDLREFFTWCDHDATCAAELPGGASPAVDVL